MKIDPSKFIDLSSKTIMPVFNENDFLFKIDEDAYSGGELDVDFEIKLNDRVIARHRLDLSRYITQNAEAERDNEEEKVFQFKTSLVLHEKEKG